MTANDCLPVLKAQHDAIDRLMALVLSLDKTDFMPSKSGKIWEAVVAGYDLIKRIEAEG